MNNVLTRAIPAVVAVLALAAPQVAGASPIVQTGTVNASGVRWRAHPVEVAGPSQIAAIVTYSTPARLTASLKDVSGNVVAVADEPVRGRLELSATVPGPAVYRLAIYAKQGKSTYHVTMNVTPVPPLEEVPTPPSPTAAPEPSPEPSAEPSAEPSPVSEPLPTETATPTPTAEPTEESPSTPATGEGTLRFWAAENESKTHRVTLAEAIAHARRFDVISALPSTYRDYVAAMKQENPRLVLLAYVNGTFARKDEGDRYPEDWYARDSSGRKITSTAFGNYLMNPRRQGWVETRVSECQALLLRTGYDGCMVDMLTFAPLFAGYASGIPIDPLTGVEWTRPDWLAATRGIAGNIRAAIAPGLVVGNGVGSGHLYSDAKSPTRVLLDGADGALAESWLRTSGQAIDQYRKETQWKAAVDSLADANARGKTMHVYVKVWTQATQAQLAAWHEYSLATFLLGTGGHSYFTFSDSREHNPTDRPLAAGLNLGPAVGSYYRSDGVYQRRFAAGRVIVNPTTTGRAVALDAPYLDHAGAVVDSVWVGPNRGMVLTVP